MRNVTHEIKQARMHAWYMLELKAAAAGNSFCGHTTTTVDLVFAIMIFSKE